MDKPVSEMAAAIGRSCSYVVPDRRSVQLNFHSESDRDAFIIAYVRAWQSAALGDTNAA